jgi:hypothetical protein
MISYAEVAHPSPTPSIVSAITQNHPAPPASSSTSLRQVLSSNQNPVPPIDHEPPASTGPDDMVAIDGHFYRCIHATSVSYNLSNHASTPVLSSLVDGGANGGMADDDVRILTESSFSKANVTGIGESQIQNLSLATVAGHVATHCGPAVAILNQYANYRKGHTIHSSSQLRACGILVHDTPQSNDGLQHLIMPDGNHTPFCCRSGLPYMGMRPPTDGEFDTLPHIFLTGDDVWNPGCIDNKLSIEDLLLDTPEGNGDQDPQINDIGDYTGNIEEDIDLLIHQCRAECDNHNDTHGLPDLLERHINQCTVSKAAPNIEAHHPNFGWLPIERIKKIIQATTQFARTAPRYPFRKHYRTHFPAANCNQWNKDVATDIFFSDTAAHDDGIFGHGGYTMAQLYTGK